MRGKNMKFWKNLLLICAGVVIGSLVASLTKNIKYLSWLSFGLDFGTAAPVTLNMGIMQLTLGASINITVSVIIFVVLTYVIGRKLLK